MTLWRVINHISLDGSGGLRASGRWHARGRRIVYCAALVHAGIEVEDIPVTFRYMESDAPDSVAIETADSNALGQAWQTTLQTTRQYGASWLRSGRTALLRVPSAIVPATWNILVNPRHPDSAQFRIARVHEHASTRACCGEQIGQRGVFVLRRQPDFLACAIRNHADSRPDSVSC